MMSDQARSKREMRTERNSCGSSAAAYRAGTVACVAARAVVPTAAKRPAIAVYREADYFFSAFLSFSSASRSRQGFFAR